MSDLGNPRKPEGKAGSDMLHRMNESHYEMTGWGLEYLHFKAEDKILDIGCGGGMTLNRISKKVTQGHLTGIDYSEVSVAESKELNADLIAKGRMEIVEGSVEALPFADKSFDKIVTVESFYFWPDPPENLKEVFRVLKADGHFLLIAEVYNGANLSDHDKDNIQKYELFNPTIDEFHRYFEAAGFTDVKAHTIAGHCWVAVEGKKE